MRKYLNNSDLLTTSGDFHGEVISVFQDVSNNTANDHVYHWDATSIAPASDDIIAVDGITTGRWVAARLYNVKVPASRTITLGGETKLLSDHVNFLDYNTLPVYDDLMSAATGGLAPGQLFRTSLGVITMALPQDLGGR